MYLEPNDFKLSQVLHFKNQPRSNLKFGNYGRLLPSLALSSKKWRIQGLVFGWANLQQFYFRVIQEHGLGHYNRL